MEEKSFLPDKRPVRAHVLAQISLSRATIDMIARGAIPADQRAYGNPPPVWGLLYIGESGIGFFVHPSDNYMGFAFRTSTDLSQSEPIDLFIPFGEITHMELLHPKTPKTPLMKTLSRFILMGDHTFIISWKRKEDEQSLRFSISADTTEFEAVLNNR